MASILKVDTIQDQAGNNIISESANVITIGASGDTITVPAGATVSGFTSAGIDDNATSTAITINSSEQVGIGTASPDHLLHISANSTNAQLKLQRTGSATASFNIAASSDSLAFSDQAASTERMRITSTGLGIGTSSPTEALHVVGDILATGGDFKSDANNYLGFSNNTFARFVINDSEKMRITSAGRVGIGTASPNVDLNVVASNGGNVEEIFELRNNSTTAGTGSRLRFVNSTVAGTTGNSVSISSYRNSDGDQDLIFETVGSEAMRIDSSGNVSIGTTVAIATLNVLADSGSQGIDVLGRSSDNRSRIQLSSNNGTTTYSQWDYNGTTVELKAVANVPLVFRTNNTERMRIDSSGNVGIGETAPLGKLHVKSADSGGTPNTQYDELVLEQNGNNCGMTILCNSPGDGAIYFGDSADNDIGGIAYSHFDNKMFFKVNGSERMRIDSSGHFGFGTTTSSNFVNFQGGSSNSTGINFDNTSSPNPYGYRIAFTAASPDSNSQYFHRMQDSTTVRCIIYSDGDIVNHDNSYGGISDIKLKEQITNASSQWEDIKNLQVKKFKYKTDVANGDSDAHWRLGLIAQEVETTSPNLVKNNPDLDDNNNDLGTVTKTVKYSILYMKAVKALQEAMERIEQLETKNTELEARITALETNNP